MSESDKSKVKIAIGELRVGHFVDLELSWTDHPFLFSRFKISSQAEIDAIREMGLKEVTVLPDRSDVKPPQRRASDRPEGTTPTVAPAAAAPASAAQPALSGSIRQQLWNRKQDLIHRASGFRSERQQVANRYTETVRKINTFARDVRSAPANAIMVAEEIVEEMASAFDKESSVLLNLVNLNGSEYTIYSHALNVTVLSLVLGRHVGLEPEDLRVLGMGAIVHDIGKIEIPTQITAKTTPLNAAEEALLRTHTTAGARLAQRIRALPNGVIEIIERHHEHVDGSGYPRGLKGDHIPLVVRIVAIANVYDNLCNPPDPSKGISPRDAMGLLFKNYINVFDAELINKFILAMGVYPPGTVVQLSDDNIGMVVSVDPDNLLRPRIILYNPDIPRSEALMVDLRERPDIQIRNVMKPREFPVRIYEYLGITERLGYFYKTPEQGR